MFRYSFRAYSCLLSLTALGFFLLPAARAQHGNGFTFTRIAGPGSTDVNGNPITGTPNAYNAFRTDGTNIVFTAQPTPTSTTTVNCGSNWVIYTAPFNGGPITPLVTPSTQFEASDVNSTGKEVCTGPIISDTNVIYGASYTTAANALRYGFYSIPVAGGASSLILAKGDPLPGTTTTARTVRSGALDPAISTNSLPVESVALPNNTFLVDANLASNGALQRVQYTSAGAVAGSATESNITCSTFSLGATTPDAFATDGNGLYVSRANLFGTGSSPNSFSNFRTGVIASSSALQPGCNSLIFDPTPSTGVASLPSEPVQPATYSLPSASVYGAAVLGATAYFSASQTLSDGSVYSGIFASTGGVLTKLFSTRDSVLPGLNPTLTNCDGTPTNFNVIGPVGNGKYLVFFAIRSLKDCSTHSYTPTGGLYAYDKQANVYTLVVPVHAPLYPGDVPYVAISGWDPSQGQLSASGQLIFGNIDSVDPVSYQPLSTSVYSVYLGQALTTVALTAPSTSNLAGSAVLTASVSRGSSTSALTGVVQFLDGTALLGTQTIDSTGSATLSVTGLTPGSHSITASYTGNPFFQGATSAVSVVTVPNSAVLPAVPFPTTNSGTTTSQQTVTVPFHGTVTLGSVNILTQGAQNLDFKAQPNDTSTTLCSPGQTYTNGQTCTVDVVFAPTAPGLRSGAVVITAADQQSNFTGSAPDNTVYYGGAPYCPYSGTLSLITLALGIDPAAGTVNSGQVTTRFTETVLNGCNVTTGPPTDNVFTLSSATLNGNQISAVFTGAAANSLLLSSTATFTGTISGNTITGTLNITRSGLQGTNLYFAFSPTVTLSSAATSPTTLPNATLSTSYVSGVGVGPLGVFTPGLISTIAGSLTATAPGDGGAALSAKIGPNQIALDGAGNLYFGDTATNTIRKISSGKIQSVAGNGVVGYSGDGGPATQASFNVANGNVAIDGAGNLFIADKANHAVRRVDAVSGIITTVAGVGGSAGYSGDGGPAARALLNAPETVVLDGAGNLYIADYYNGRVRKVDAVTHQIQTIAGIGTNSSAPYSGDGGLASQAAIGTPSAIAFDPSGNLYIADDTDCAVRKVNASTNIITLFAGSYVCGYSGDGGPATSAQFKYSEMIALDAAGNLFLSDYANATFRKVNAATGIISTVAGQDNPNVSATGSRLTPKPSSGDGGPATSAYVQYADGLTLDPAGNLYLTDAGLIRMVSVTPAPLAFASLPASQTSAAQSVLFGNSGNAPLQASQLTVPTNFTQVQAAGNNCSSSSTLAPAVECILQIAFTPTIAGPIQASASIADNAPASPHSVPLYGAATAASTTVAVTASLSPAGSSGPVTLTATVAPFAPGTILPTGTLTFTDGTTVLGTVQLSAGSITGAISTGALAAGTHVITVAYSGDAAFTASTATLTQVTQLPTLVWTPPAAVSYGTPLSASQLNAAAVDPSTKVAVPGSYIYTPAAGSVLNAGQQTLRVVFTPQDVLNYAATTVSTQLTVAQATPTLTWATPAPIAYGVALSSTQLNATATGLNGAALLGAFVYTPAGGTVLNPGTQTLSVTFTPTDSVDYKSATVTVSLVVNNLQLTSFTPNTTTIGSAATTITITGSGFVSTTGAQVNGTNIATTLVNPTTLTAVIPTSYFGAASTLQITLANPATGAVTAARPFSVTAPSASGTISAPSTTPPGSQPTINFALSAPYPVALTATFTLTDQSGLPSGAVDPAVQFASGGTTYTVVIPAGTTTLAPIQVQAGTIAATITVPVTLTVNGVVVNQGTLAAIIVVPSAAPAVTTSTLTRSGKTLTVTEVGFSNTREVTSASFHFVPVAGASLTTSDFTAPVGPDFAAWFANPQSLAYGSGFLYTQVFNVSDDASKIASVQITLTNSIGVSTTQTVQ